MNFSSKVAGPLSRGFIFYLLSLLECPEVEGSPGRIPAPGLDDLYIWRKAEHGWEEGSCRLGISQISSILSLEPFPPFSSGLGSTKAPGSAREWNVGNQSFTKPLLFVFGAGNVFNSSHSQVFLWNFPLVFPAGNNLTLERKSMDT